VTTETTLRHGRRRGKGSKGTVASPGGRRWGRFGRRRAGSGAIASGGARVLRGNRRWWRRLKAPAADSTDGEEEGNTVNLGACLSARGEAASGGAGRQPWRRCSGAHREEEEKANGEASEEEKGREEASRHCWGSLGGLLGVEAWSTCQVLLFLEKFFLVHLFWFCFGLFKETTQVRKNM
jgi:hypothetical protein